MTISFDLDDTLIPASKIFPTEEQNWLLRLLGIEKVRKGTVGLLKELKSRGHTIYIYTTSYRSTRKILLTFHLYGIPIDRFINQEHHNNKLKEHRNRTSKYPPAFGIDVHVDDLPGVKMEGELYNFRTIIIDPQDSNWTETVLRAMGE
ncbi:HAD family hydrolase [Hymenobacter guriensis]|uniref:HAD family hydrolase n=1 Tax=Hymenobacter guriensis TaxID=2793065 RepID=A0ABS0KVZ3_9BACT|nr:HAD family hydrolase [Hymenobacter guriensis]MBG8552011.1 HAD family hydrolase [Hymenobacter guriensis]